MHVCIPRIVFAKVNHWTLEKVLLDRNVPLHIVKQTIFFSMNSKSLWYVDVTHYR